MKPRKQVDLRGRTPESWHCVGCGFNTAPGHKSRAEMQWEFNSGKDLFYEVGTSSEMYMVKDHVWNKAGMPPMGGCLCVGCLEKRIGRKLVPKDFAKQHIFNDMPGTVRLMSRQIGDGILEHELGLFVVVRGEATLVKTKEEAEEILREEGRRRLGVQDVGIRLAPTAERAPARVRLKPEAKMAREDRISRDD
jgi:hypothetical protein